MYISKLKEILKAMKKLISSVLIIAMALSMVLVSSVSALAETTDGLPDMVDLSTDEYFPPIKSQGDNQN